MENVSTKKFTELEKVNYNGNLFFLVDINDFLIVEQTALKHIRIALENKEVTTIAFYANNLVNRSILFCLMLMYQPNLRIEIFCNKQDAIDWLKDAII